MKGSRRELIQFGIPIFGHIKEEATSTNEIGRPILLNFVTFNFTSDCDCSWKSLMHNPVKTSTIPITEFHFYFYR